MNPDYKRKGFPIIEPQPWDLVSKLIDDYPVSFPKGVIEVTISDSWSIVDPGDIMQLVFSSEDCLIESV